jgi:quinol monooxygenase YgiN
MKAVNVVRFRVKPGREKEFIDYNRGAVRGFPGFLGGSLVRTGDQTFCLVGEWNSHQSLVAARPNMIATLDGMRHLLEDLGGGLGVTDPVSGDVVVTLSAGKAPKKAAKKKAKKTAKRPARKSAPKKKKKKK